MCCARKEPIQASKPRNRKRRVESAQQANTGRRQGGRIACLAKPTRSQSQAALLANAVPTFTVKASAKCALSIRRRLLGRPRRTAASAILDTQGRVYPALAVKKESSKSGGGVPSVLLAL